MRRTPLVLLGCGLCWLLTASSPAAAEKLNVLFLIADDLNCDLHCYGHPHAQTPHIDELAARGVRFEHVYCQYPVCAPSRSSFLTGRRPNVTRIYTNSRRNMPASTIPASKPDPANPTALHFREFIPDTVTLPQLFRQNGYYAARVGKLYHYGVPGQIGTSGVDDPPSWENVVNPAGRDKAEEHKVFALKKGGLGSTLSWLASDGADAEQTDGLSATAAVSLLEQIQERPFFLAVGFYRPHTPYISPRQYFAQYMPQAFSLPVLSAADKERTPAAAFKSAHPEQDTMSDDLRRQAMQAYWASISFMDAQVGRVVAALDKLGLRDKTVIVMTSDHGYHMGQHGLWQKNSLFENSARVPLVIAAPGMRGNGKSARGLAELVDLYPTLAEICGLPAPDYLDGTSLRPLLDDPARTVKDAAFTQVFRGTYHAYSLRTPRWRCTLWDDGKLGTQLYDMEADPSETTNLADDPQHARTVADLTAKIRAYAASSP